MATNKFIPAVWSTRTLAHLDKALVYGNVVNTEYEGEIKQHGDTVKINQVGDILVSDYTGSLTGPEDLDTEQVLLVIDKAKSFNFKVDDIDSAQANVNLLNEGTKRAAYALREVVDTDIAGLVDQAGIKVGSATTPIALTVENVYDTLVDLGVTLSEANVSKSDRFIVLPAQAIGLLTKDQRFTRDDKVLTNGTVSIGRVAGFDIRESNNVPVTAKKYSVMAGSQAAVAFAGQISKIEGYQPENSFSEAVKGLYVYGAKVIQPAALAKVVIEFA